MQVGLRSGSALGQRRGEPRGSQIPLALGRISIMLAADINAGVVGETAVISSNGVTPSASFRLLRIHSPLPYLR